MDLGNATSVQLNEDELLDEVISIHERLIHHAAPDVEVDVIPHGFDLTPDVEDDRRQ